MSKKDFKMPVFKHMRRDLGLAIYGGLSEDAAYVASEEATRKIKAVFDAMSEEAKADGRKGFSKSECLERVLSGVDTMEEAILAIDQVFMKHSGTYHMGRMMSEMMNEEDDN